MKDQRTTKCRSCGSLLAPQRLYGRSLEEALAAHRGVCSADQREPFLQRVRAGLAPRERASLELVTSILDTWDASDRAERDRTRPGWCEECQARHTREDRQAVLRRLLPRSPEEIKGALEEGYPCFYGALRGDTAGDRRLVRDLTAIGAVFDGLEWKFAAPTPARTAEAA